MKTHKATAKRLKVTKTSKVLKRAAGQDHFKSRQSGNARRNMRRDVSLSGAHKFAIETLLPGTSIKRTHSKKKKI